MDTQDGWRRCNVCGGVFSINSPGQSCVGGSMHSWPTSAEYKAPWGDVEADCQAGWGRCTKCGGLCFTGNPGVCFDQAPHTYDEFDASYNRGAPLDFPLGAGRVIAGWDQGVQGMKVGGRRQLVIPPHLGYGDRGAGGVIKPGETLVFVVDLLGVS